MVLTKSLNNIQLGGDLTTNTTITQDATESLIIINNGTAKTTINLQNTGDFDVQDNGTSALFVGDNGNVGIGTNNPLTKIQVEGASVDALGHLLVNRSNSAGLGGAITVRNTAGTLNTAAAIAFELDGSTAFNTSTGASDASAEIRAIVNNATTKATDLTFTNWSGSSINECMRINSAGNVGIGTTTPNSPLQFSNSLANRKIVLFDTNNNDHQYYGFGIQNNTLRYQTPASADNHVFYSGINTTSSKELMRIKGNGNIGIGNNNPTEALDVTGKTKTTNLQVLPATAPTIGQVLTANDVLGNAIWQTPATGGGTLNATYNFGGAGLGRTITANDGVVNISGEDGFLVIGSPGAGLAIGDAGGIPSGSGTRMFFNPRKSAFRAGTVSAGSGANQWNVNNVGSYSAAFGDTTEASGVNSTAMGAFTKASSQSSTAMGEYTTASGFVSTAMGSYNIASGFISTAMGEYTTASGIVSTAMGSSNIASGFISTAMGSSNIASGNVSTAMSVGTFSKSIAETAIGIYSTDYTPAGAETFQSADRIFSVGNGTGTATRSNALTILKNGNTAIGNINPNVKLDVDGALAVRRNSNEFVATTDDYSITIGNNSYIHGTSNAGLSGGLGAATRTIILSDGLQVGQLLILQSSNDDPFNPFEILAGTSNVRISGPAIVFDRKDTAQFIWDGADWSLITFSNNN